MAGEIGFTIESRWDGDILDDLRNLLEGEVMQAIRLGLATARGTAKDLLKEHIISDVYNAYGEPKDYVRRYEAGLLDLENSLNFDDVREGLGVAQMTMQYYPHGDSPQWEEPAYADRMIDRIENDKGYEWDVDVGPRPYWTNFVWHMMNESDGFAAAGARMADSLRAEGMTVDYDGFNEIQDDDGDGQYDRY